MSDEMAAAHSQDYRDHARMSELLALEALQTFLADPPLRCHRRTVEALQLAVDGLKGDCAQIVRTWN